MGVGPAVITPAMSQEFLKCDSCGGCSVPCFSAAAGLGCDVCTLVFAVTLATGTTLAPKNSNQLPPKRFAPCLIGFTLVSPASSQVGPTTLAVRLLPQVTLPAVFLCLWVLCPVLCPCCHCVWTGQWRRLIFAASFQSDTNYCSFTTNVSVRLRSIELL